MYSAIKWLFVMAAFLYLAYKLMTFDQYDEFFQQWALTPACRFWWLAGVFLLLPFNWILESVKWMRITSHLQQLSFMQSLKGVLAGITTGFFTPNRIGELVGRIFFLQPENRTAGITLSLLNSLTQNLTIIFCGIPACILLFSQRDNMSSGIWTYLLIALFLLILLSLFYFYLPGLNKKVETMRFGKKIDEFIACLAGYSEKDLISIILVSFVRYVVFFFAVFLYASFF